MGEVPKRTCICGIRYPAHFLKCPTCDEGNRDIGPDPMIPKALGFGCLAGTVIVAGFGFLCWKVADAFLSYLGAVVESNR